MQTRRKKMERSHKALQRYPNSVQFRVWSRFPPKVRFFTLQTSNCPRNGHCFYRDCSPGEKFCRECGLCNKGCRGETCQFCGSLSTRTRDPNVNIDICNRFCIISEDSNSKCVICGSSENEDPEKVVQLSAENVRGQLEFIILAYKPLKPFQTAFRMSQKVVFRYLKTNKICSDSGYSTHVEILDVASYLNQSRMLQPRLSTELISDIDAHENPRYFTTVRCLLEAHLQSVTIERLITMKSSKKLDLAIKKHETDSLIAELEKVLTAS